MPILIKEKQLKSPPTLTTHNRAYDLDIIFGCSHFLNFTLKTTIWKLRQPTQKEMVYGLLKMNFGL